MTEDMMAPKSKNLAVSLNRRSFIGGSDARVIMGNDEALLVRLYREKRGEVEPEDLSRNLLVQLDCATEDLNRRWFEHHTGQAIRDVQRWLQHPVIGWMAATLDSIVEGTGPCSRLSSCCLGRFRKKQRPKSIWLSCSIICGSRMPNRRLSRLSPAEASGSN